MSFSSFRPSSHAAVSAGDAGLDASCADACGDDVHELDACPEPPQIAYFEAQIVARAAEERGMTPATLSQAMHRVLKERHLAVLQPYSLRQ